MPRSGARANPSSLKEATGLLPHMFRYSRFKITAVLVLALAGFLYAAPSILSPEARLAIKNGTPSWIPAWIVPHQAIVLGLDLQGGSHVLLEVDQQAILKSQVSTLRDDMRRILREQKVALAGGLAVQNRSVSVRISDATEKERVLPKLRELTMIDSISLMQGSGSASLELIDQNDGLVTVSLTEFGLKEKVRKAIDQAIEVLRRRIDALGTTEPNIQRQGIDRILVQVPGLQDPQRLKEILGTTAQLEFRMVSEPGAAPGDVDMLPSQDAGGATLPIEKRVIVQGEDLIDAQPAFDSRNNEPIVNFKFNIRGAQKFGQAILEGGIEGRPENVIFYATSNRRHLLPRDMMENEKSSAINPGEAVEEKVSLSDRFGLWLGFHKCSQDEYLEMVSAYAENFDLQIDEAQLHHSALEWATTRGYRSGRTAWQFIQDLAGKLEVRLDEKQ